MNDRAGLLLTMRHKFYIAKYCFLLLFFQLKDYVSLPFEIMDLYKMSLVMRKPAFCICENKDADQLRGNREADQRLCFRYTDSTIPLLP